MPPVCFFPQKKIERVVPYHSPKLLALPCPLCHPLYPYPQAFALVTARTEDTIPNLFKTLGAIDDAGDFYTCPHADMTPTAAYVEIAGGGDLAPTPSPPFACLSGTSITWSGQLCTGAFGHLENWRTAVLPRGSRFLVPVNEAQMFNLTIADAKIDDVWCIHSEHKGACEPDESSGAHFCSKTVFETRMSLLCDSYIVNMPAEPYAFGTNLTHDGQRVHVKFTDGTYGAYWGD